MSQQFVLVLIHQDSQWVGDCSTRVLGPFPHESAARSVIRYLCEEHKLDGDEGLWVDDDFNWVLRLLPLQS